MRSAVGLLLAVTALTLPALPAAAQIKVAALGASTTRGTGSSTGHSYPDELGRLLGGGYQVRNYGRGGATVLRQTPVSYWSSPELAQALASQPAIALVWIGGADSSVAHWESGKGQFLADFVALIQRVQALPSKPRVFVMLSSARADEGSVRARVVNEEIQPLQRQGASQTGASIIDVPAALMGRAEYFADGIHLNDSGYLTVAKLVAAAIQSKPVEVDAGADGPVDSAIASDGPVLAVDSADGPPTAPDAATAVDVAAPPAPIAPRPDAAPPSMSPPAAAPRQGGGCSVLPRGGGAVDGYGVLVMLAALVSLALRRRR